MKLLAPLVLASSLAACSDRAPQVIAVREPAATDVAHPGVMTVTGTATLDVSPDCADLTITLTADASRPATAASTLAKKQDALVVALKGLGIATADLKLSTVSLDPIYKEWQQIRVATYRAAITITATTHKFEQLPDMMEAGATAGATSMSSQFRRSDLAELKKKVREMALKAAKEKAQQTASALGIQLGHVTSVAEAPAGVMWHSAYFPNYIANEANTAPAPDGRLAIGGALQPLTLDITVGFELAKQT